MGERKNIENQRLNQKLLFSSRFIYQKICLHCSFQHVKTSLLKWGNSFEIPKNIRKLEMDHDDINELNYIEKQLFGNLI